MPISAIACDHGRVDGVGRCGPAERTGDTAAGVVGEQGGGHLGAPGVVDADEQHFGVELRHRDLEGIEVADEAEATGPPMTCMR